MKENIGLFTWLGDGNYGTALQAYALYSAISKLGHPVYVLSHKSPRRELKKFFCNKRTNASACHIRRFHKERMKIRTAWCSAGLRLHNLSTKAYVCGSDQMWNTWHSFNPFNFLSFAGRCKRIAYAPSLGAASFEPSTENAVRALLSRFDHISLREESSTSAVRKLSGRSDVVTVLDPVFLPDRAEWESIASGAEKSIGAGSGYILCYLLKNRDYDAEIADIRRLSGIDKVAVIPATENQEIKIGGAEYFPGAGVEDFMQLIRNASLVVTDSFHATAFSIIFGKQFVEFKRFSENDPASQNSRIACLLESLGLEGRFYDEGKWQSTIDYSTINQKLDPMRRQSLEYLRKALED